MLTHYIQTAMRHASYELLNEDQSYYGEIPNFRGVWANAPTQEACQQELQSALEVWILVRIEDHLHLPVVDGIDLNRKPEVA
jgi:predicted RNase H-like HicB family nuclease